MKKLRLNILFLLGIVAFSMPVLQSCNDEPDGDSFYSFTGQMMSEYLTENPQFSMYATIVERAGLMDQLSTYGHYTCFAPTNEAMNAYLAAKGITLDDLSDADCDTLALSHLVDVMYSVSEMGGESSTSVLPTQNMMRRNLQITHEQDENGNSVVVVNGGSVVFFEHQDDSVENGIMQPVSAVIENSTLSTGSIIKKNPRLTLYTRALEATKLFEPIDQNIKDRSYNEADYLQKHRYVTGHGIYEVANPPAEKLYGYTAFMVPDDILEEKYGITTLEGLYQKACEIYDPMFPEDVNKPEHGFDHLTSPINPLYRFMAYHLLDRNVQGFNFLTVRDNMGVDRTLANATDWYTTMLPYTMIKVERLFVDKPGWLDEGAAVGDRFINRRYDDTGYSIRGAKVSVVEEEYPSDGINGVYFYVDDILAFDKTTRDIVDNCRIRMDFSTIFPEVMTNNHRMNGDYKDDEGRYDDSYKHGKNYYYPEGYLNNVEYAGSGNDGFLIYRRPRPGFYSLHGDEFIAQGMFDITFQIPPVPFTSTWQIRLGFAPMNKGDGAARGVVQVYFDGVAQGIPLNMEEKIGSANIYGSGFNPVYSDFRNDESKRSEDFKILKNKGYYRGPYSMVRSGDIQKTMNGEPGERFSDRQETVRKVLCTVTIEAGKPHTLRIKNVTAIFPKTKEAMLDYLELVPRSVFAISDQGTGEDDL